MSCGRQALSALTRSAKLKYHTDGGVLGMQAGDTYLLILYASSVTHLCASLTCFVLDVSLCAQDDMAARLRSVLSLAGIPQEGFPVKVRGVV